MDSRGLIKKGASLDQARRDSQAVAQHIREANPSIIGNRFGFTVLPVSDFLVGDVKPPLHLLMGAVAFVLLIAAANVASLTLVRATARQRELAIRRALGATGSQISTLLFVESLILAGFGALLGLPFAQLLLRVVVGLAPANTPRLEQVSIDGRVLAFTAVAGLVSALVFGLAPVVRMWRRKDPALQGAGRTSGQINGGRSWTLNILATAEIAMALLLLIGANLLVTSFVRLHRVGLGFDPTNVLTLELSLPSNRYSTPEKIRTFYRSCREADQARWTHSFKQSVDGDCRCGWRCSPDRN